MPLANQIKQGQNVVVTVPLRGIGAAPGFADGGTTFNSGDPTATYTIAIPNGPLIENGAFYELLKALDDLQRNGGASVA
jgi:hypothetical protein